MPKPLRQLTVLSAVALSVVLVTGTMVTGAGPHAGDKSVDAPVPRLGLDIVTLVLPALGRWWRLRGVADRPRASHCSPCARPRPVTLRVVVLLVLVALQGMVGTVQFYTGVPAVLVAVHVAGAAACTAATAALWASMRQRSVEGPEPEPIQG